MNNDIEKMQILVLHVLCHIFQELGPSESINTAYINEILRKKNVYSKLGDIELAIHNLKLKGLVVDDEFNKYTATMKGYAFWIENKKLTKQEENKTVAEAEQSDDDLWQPVEVENYEELAEQSDDLAKVLDEENGYKATRPEEAKSTIETIRSFAKILREDGGKTILKAVQVVWQFVWRLTTFIEKTTRIGQVLYPLAVLIATFLGFPFS